MEQLTDNDDSPTLNALAGGPDVSFEQFGYLHVYTSAANIATQLVVDVATDLIETQEVRPLFPVRVRRNQL